MLALVLLAALADADEFRLPSNISVAAVLLPIVEDALRASPSLRAQCHRIGRMKRVRVSVELDASEFPAPGVSTRAHTNIRRYEFGLVVAAVHLWSIRDAASLLAHELEHVSEFAEGLDYRAQAARNSHDVWMTGPNTFETVRAVRAGRVVANEIAGQGLAMAQAPRR